MATVAEVFVVTASGSGHLFPCIELCKHLSSRNSSSILVLPSTTSSAVSPSHLHPIAAVIEITVPTRGKSPDDEMGLELEAYLSTRSSFWRERRCHGAWARGSHARVVLNPGEVHLIPGLPDEMNITYEYLVRRPNQAPRPAAAGGPPQPGDRAPWVSLVEGSIALMFNTCDDLEHSFLDYLANQMGLPVWGVGPLLPYQYCPTKEEILHLANALEEMPCPFIWVVQNGLISSSSIGDHQENESFNLDDLDKKIGEGGLIIRGWAPQLLILRHPSTGGFLSHCGWNSTMEAIGRGVPILAWPIRGDQIYNAKLVVNHLKIGYMALPSGSLEMVKDDLTSGIEKLMMDEVVHKQADILRAKFGFGFPTSSKCALDAFKDFVKQNQT
ncbi:hypothetical protein Pfo_025192 [Paulownia fortunei]|nr:hypothetical protein Pfo_025192 [Paulownia fortunei]